MNNSRGKYSGLKTLFAYCYWNILGVENPRAEHQARKAWKTWKDLIKYQEKKSLLFSKTSALYTYNNLLIILHNLLICRAKCPGAVMSRNARGVAMKKQNIQEGKAILVEQGILVGLYYNISQGEPEIESKEQCLNNTELLKSWVLQSSGLGAAYC